MSGTRAPDYLSVTVDGAAIRARRVELCLTLKAFAGRVPMSHTYLSDLELGRRPRMGRDKFALLVAALDVTPDSIRPTAKTQRRRRAA